ncbi:MFS transporter, DHA2 family, multidrug resistance protein [Collimonas sp. OK607]|uniref:MFS transporter n=1 Tax=Collimonas sp. OK607 TaxID=1798194 RepID=UPI0008E826AF|nr:MFS transporter [Collimonas sp. OK607]SFB28631.1 MFS transporter, DHA2 family, multidrug resistance protein [Collimonas sp. OK607]
MSDAKKNDGLPFDQRRLAIATVICGLAMAVMDGTIANLALPSIARDMHASAAESIWIINSYQIAMAICLLPLASLGEIVGYRRIYLIGLIMFTLASLACGSSNTIAQLSIARVLQGFGAAGMLSVNIALIRFIYPANMLGRAVGYNALVAGSATALGPTVAGLILSVASWHWLFLINVPVGIVVLAIGYRALPTNPLADRRYDTLSAILCMVSVGSLLYTVDAIGHLQGILPILGSAAITVFVVVLLLRFQSANAPMLPIDLLKIPLFSLSIGTSICSFAAQTAAYVMLPFYLQEHLGQSAAHAGLLLTAWPAAVALTALVAGKMSDRISAGLLGGIGLAILTLGLLSLLTVTADSADGLVAMRLAVCGFGFGMFQSPNNRTMISVAPSLRSGAASGMLGTGRLMGQTAGASIVAFALTATSSPYVVILVSAAILSGAACCVSLRRVGLSPAVPI